MTRARAALLCLAAAAAVLLIASACASARSNDDDYDDSPANDLFSVGSFFHDKLEMMPVKGAAEYNQLFVRHTDWVNSIVLRPFLSPSLRSQLPHSLVSWLRNYVAGIFVYFLSGGLWCLVVYWWKKDVYFPKGNIPAHEPIKLQILVSMKAMPLYSALPTLAEYFVEKGWTRCYAGIEEVGWINWLMNVCLYMMFNEFFIYWMHRLLHDIKPLYKLFHATHHIYNKENTLSPFAGLAFNPIDGILQACPHVFALFVVPTHLFTHELLFFGEALWTTNIHDCIHGDVFGILGAGYHAIHHTTYRHNYGHYTVFMDWLLGTLRPPEMRKDKELKSS